MQSILSRAFVFCGLIGMLAFVPQASASEVTYDFTLTGTYGPLTGTVSSGSFSFDSSLASPKAVVVGANLLDGLNLTLDGNTYNTSTANTGYLTFDSTGQLSTFCFGNNAGSGYCSVGGPNQVFVDAGGFSFEDANLVYSVGTVAFAQASPAATPEPGSLALLGTAVLSGAGAMRRRVVK